MKIQRLRQKYYDCCFEFGQLVTGHLNVLRPLLVLKTVGVLILTSLPLLLSANQLEIDAVRAGGRSPSSWSQKKYLAQCTVDLNDYIQLYNATYPPNLVLPILVRESVDLEVPTDEAGLKRLTKKLSPQIRIIVGSNNSSELNAELARWKDVLNGSDDYAQTCLSLIFDSLQSDLSLIRPLGYLLDKSYESHLGITMYQADGQEDLYYKKDHLMPSFLDTMELTFKNVFLTVVGVGAVSILKSYVKKGIPFLVTSFISGAKTKGLNALVMVKDGYSAFKSFDYVYGLGITFGLIKTSLKGMKPIRWLFNLISHILVKSFKYGSGITGISIVGGLIDKNIQNAKLDDSPKYLQIKYWHFFNYVKLSCNIEELVIKARLTEEQKKFQHEKGFHLLANLYVDFNNIADLYTYLRTVQNVIQKDVLIDKALLPSKMRMNPDGLIEFDDYENSKLQHKIPCPAYKYKSNYIALLTENRDEVRALNFSPIEQHLVELHKTLTKVAADLYQQPIQHAVSELYRELDPHLAQLLADKEGLTKSDKAFVATLGKKMIMPDDNEFDPVDTEAEERHRESIFSRAINYLLATQQGAYNFQSVGAKINISSDSESDTESDTELDNASDKQKLEDLLKNLIGYLDKTESQGEAAKADVATKNSTEHKVSLRDKVNQVATFVTMNLDGYKSRQDPQVYIANWNNYAVGLFEKYSGNAVDALFTLILFDAIQNNNIYNVFDVNIGPTKQGLEKVSYKNTLLKRKQDRDNRVNALIKNSVFEKAKPPTLTTVFGRLRQSDPSLYQKVPKTNPSNEKKKSKETAALPVFASKVKETSTTDIWPARGKSSLPFLLAMMDDLQIGSQDLNRYLGIGDTMEDKINIAIDRNNTEKQNKKFVDKFMAVQFPFLSHLTDLDVQLVEIMSQVYGSDSLDDLKFETYGSGGFELLSALFKKPDDVAQVKQRKQIFSQAAHREAKANYSRTVNYSKLWHMVYGIVQSPKAEKEEASDD